MNRLTNFIQKQPFISAALLTSLLASVIIWFVHLTLSTDDFSFLGILHSDTGLGIRSFDAFIGRQPLGALSDWVYFHIPGAESLKVPFILTFFVYSFSVARIFQYFFKQIKITLEPRKAFWITLVLLLYPTHYEILYWLAAMAYIAGLGFWALSLGTMAFVQIGLQSAAFMNSEMYILPALLLPILILIINDNLVFKAVAREVLKWLASLGIFFAVRSAVHYSLALPSYHYDLKFSPGFIFSRIMDSFFSVYAIHFYKIYWPNTILYWILLAIMLWIASRQSLISNRKLVAIFGISFFVTGIYWIYGHYAPRALFGAQILICTCVFYLLSVFEWKKLKYFLPILALVFISATANILRIKWKNYYALTNLEREWTAKLSDCSEPCTLEMKDLDKDIHNDWVLNRSFWSGYVVYVKNKHHIKKPVNLFWSKDKN